MGRTVRFGSWVLSIACALSCADDEGALMPSGGHGGRSEDAGGAGGSGGRDASAHDGGGTSGAQPVEDSGSDADVDVDVDVDGAMQGDGSAPLVACEPRAVTGSPEMHFHHVHFNTVDPDDDLAFFEKFFDAPPVTFCSDASGVPLARATRTERGWFLYTKVAEAPDARLNTYLEHVGWVHPMPAEELARQLALGIPLWPEGRKQCPEAASGVMPCPVGPLLDYFYYVQAPSGARVEVALGPGPATSGFGHVHFIMGEDLSFFETVSGMAFTDMAIDTVNHINAALTEDLLATETVVDTRGKPIDHIAYSTTDLEAAKARIEAAGIAIAEDITFKADYGFRSFFVKSPKGTWLELVEDSRFE